MSNAYIIYRSEKIPVTVESYFQGPDGLIANVKAMTGYPFYSADVQAQGETSGMWNCNGYRVRTEFVYVEPHPVEEAHALEQAMDAEFEDDWCYPNYFYGGEVDEFIPYRPAPMGGDNDLPF